MLGFHLIMIIVFFNHLVHDCHPRHFISAKNNDIFVNIGCFHDNLNNFKCAYTNDRANSLNDSTITPSMISGLEDMNGMTWGKIAKESDKVGATNNYICPNDQEI